MSKIIFISIFLLVFVSFAQADVAPEAGYTRVSVNLILEAQDDFPDYRFFLESPMDIEEIALKKGEVLNIDTTGRGGAKRIATVLAIPKTSLANFGENLSAEKLKGLHKSVQAKNVAGIIKVFNHSFIRDIPVYEKLTWENPKYRLERDATSVIKSVQVGGSSSSVNSSPARIFSPFWLGTIAAGILLSLAVLVLGVWLFRKMLRKS